ncbi:MarR family transcriptional regulator [Mesorhizobium onobrychidis]|uniref:MarR family transcriptional regulator n=1 Tax=Mesorhizobium onobrychidis TaxID=2775404 RepID=A0ABY5QUI4_9HYPH|nr:helix-turn-helix domain-containing protein [Mesorhizobium onobrychidis]UVC14738.1 MarR family transcriptional regulator [Mesorhizobium onobrychidis]
MSVGTGRFRLLLNGWDCGGRCVQNVSPSERRRRAVVLRFMFEIRSAWIEEGDPVDVTWIILAIHLGQYEGRPLSVSDIATLTLIPRTTVHRHVNELKAQGRANVIRIGHRTVPIMISPERKPAFFETLIAAIKRAADLLSSLDT